MTAPIHHYRCNTCCVVYASAAIAINSPCYMVYLDTAWIPRRCDGEIVKYEPTMASEVTVSPLLPMALP